VSENDTDSDSGWWLVTGVAFTTSNKIQHVCTVLHVLHVCCVDFCTILALQALAADAYKWKKKLGI